MTCCLATSGMYVHRGFSHFSETGYRRQLAFVLPDCKQIDALRNIPLFFHVPSVRWLVQFTARPPKMQISLLRLQKIH